LNDLYPGNFVLLLVVFILFVGAVAIMAFALGRKT